MGIHKIVAAIVLASIVLIGCGPGESETQPSTRPATAPEAAVTPSPAVEAEPFPREDILRLLAHVEASEACSVAERGGHRAPLLLLDVGDQHAGACRHGLAPAHQGEKEEAHSERVQE